MGVDAVSVLKAAEQVLWGAPMMAAFLLTGAFFTVYLRAFYLRRPGMVLSQTLGSLRASRREGGVMNQFQALCTALAASVGTGNIVGVALMLTLGGPGSVFWMWVAGILSLATGFAENVLGVRYRRRAGDGSWRGGSMYYIAQGLGAPGLGKAYALCCAVAALGMGCFVQSNSISAALRAQFSVPAGVTAGVLCVLTAVVILGGAARLGRVTERLVPAMVIAYTLCGLACLVLRARALPGVMAEILRCALSPRAAGGFGLFAALRQGVGCGVFSNEAGLGSSVMANAAAEHTTPAQQGLWSIFEIGVDTLLMCTITAFVILTSGVGGGSDGAALTMQAFAASLGDAGSFVVLISLVLFAFSTTLGWSHFGAVSAAYLFGEGAQPAFRVLFLFCVGAGCLVETPLAWCLANVLNGLMSLPNLWALWHLRGMVRAEALTLKEAPAARSAASPRPGRWRG